MKPRPRPYFDPQLVRTNNFLTDDIKPIVQEIADGFVKIVCLTCQANLIPCSYTKPEVIVIDTGIRILYYPNVVTDDHTMDKMVAPILFDVRRIIRNRFRLDVMYRKHDGRRVYVLDLVG